MGKKDPMNLYETIPEKGSSNKKAATPGSFQRERVRYVKDPLGETKYAYHINYMGDGQGSGQGSGGGQAGGAGGPDQARYATNTPFEQQGSRTLPSNMNSRRSVSDAPRRAVAFSGDEVIPPPNNFVVSDHDTYLNDPQSQYNRENNMHGGATQPYHPTSYVVDEAEQKNIAKEKLKSDKGCCSAPPCWAWVIIFLFLAVLAAVLYLIFAQVLVPRAPGKALLNTTVTSQGTTKTTGSKGSTSSMGTSTPASAPDETAPLLKTFLLTEHTRSVTRSSSTLLERSARTAASCQRACVSFREPCFGVDFTTDGQICQLITRYNYELGRLGGSPNISNYRRSFEAKSFCQESLYFHTHRTFRSSVRFIAQRDTVNSKELCQERCLGPFRNGRLDSGFRCTAAAFDSSRSRCLLTDAKYDPSMLEDSQDSTHFLNDGIECLLQPQSACSLRFNLLRMNGQPADLDASLRQDGPLNVPECASACVNFRNDDGDKCSGFVFTYSDQQPCTLYTGKTTASVQEAEGVDFYEAGTKRCEECGFIRQRDSSAWGGLLERNAVTRTACADACRQKNEDDRCYGYDFTTDNMCYLIGERGYTLRNTSNTDNYRADPACLDCRPSQFISTSLTEPIGGRLLRHQGLTACSRACQRSSESSESGHRRCYGFSYNRRTKDCSLFHNFGYRLNSIGVTPDGYHYRRLFSCDSPSCNAYDMTADTEVTSGDGLVQPWDVNTVARCQDRCWGYGLITNSSCVALDFNRRKDTCTLYTDPDYQLGALGQAMGVDHYKRKPC